MSQTDLFGEKVVKVPTTEGIKYAGSKLKLLPYIAKIIAPLPVKTVLDGFAGTTRVGQLFAKMGYQTTSNDVSVWSEVFGNCYLKNKKKPEEYKELIAHLNSLKGYEGWFTANYGGDEQTTKKPFLTKNTKKLDAIRDEIDKLDLNPQDKAVALTSLILALDKVDSTLGHYVAYLAKWAPRAYKNLNLEVPKLFISRQENHVVSGDIFDLIQHKKYDLVYYDPPYGSNNEKMPPSRVRYGAYYHIWKTVILNDKPQLFGKAMRREDSRDKACASVFEEFRKNEKGQFVAMQAIRRLLAETQAQYIVLSYSSGGRATKEELMQTLSENGTLLKAYEIDYRHNVMAAMRWTNDWINSDNKHQEYMFLIEKK